MAIVEGMTPDAIRALIKRNSDIFYQNNVAPIREELGSKDVGDGVYGEIAQFYNDLDKAKKEAKKAGEANSKKLIELDKFLGHPTSGDTPATGLAKTIEDLSKRLSDKVGPEATDELDKALAALKAELATTKSEVTKNLAELDTAMKEVDKDLEKARTEFNGKLGNLNKTLGESFKNDQKNLENRLNSNLSKYRLKADQITANDIASNAIQARHIKSNEITSEKIQAGNVTSREIASGSITANKLALVPDNIWQDPYFESDGWRFVEKNALSNGEKALKIRSNGYQIGAYTPFWIYLKPGGHYNLKFDTYVSGDFDDDKIDFFVRTKNYSGHERTYFAIPVKTITLRKSRHSMNVEFQMPEETPNHNRATNWHAGFFLKGTAKKGFVVIGNVYLTEMASAELIVDGSISADKIKSNSIQSKHIVGGAIIAGKIGANAVTTENLSAHAVTAEKILGRTITSKEIAATTIIGYNISGDTIEGKNLKSDTIGTRELKADSVTTRELAANSVTASKMVISPANLFPDPQFRDPYWGKATPRGYTFSGYPNGNNNYFTLTATGQQNGIYYDPDDNDRACKLIAGATYCLRAYCFMIGGVSSVSIYIRYRNTSQGRRIFRACTIPLPKTDDRYPVVEFTAPGDMWNGECSVGFHIENFNKTGKVIIKDVSITEKVTSDLIVDGSITAEKLKADSITVRELKANTIIPIGNSLIPMEPISNQNIPEPIWHHVFDKVEKDGKGIEWRYCSRAENKQYAEFVPERWVKVDPDATYLLSYKIRGSLSKSKIFLEMRNQKGDNCVVSNGGELCVVINRSIINADADVLKYAENPAPYLINNKSVPGNGYYSEYQNVKIRFTADTEYVRLARVHFNHSTSNVKTRQYLADLTLTMEVPSQKEIDALQTKQITDNAARIADNKKRLAETTALANENKKLINKNGEQDAKLTRIVDDVVRTYSTSIFVPNDLCWYSEDAGFGLVMPHKSRYIEFYKNEKFDKANRLACIVIFYSNGNILVKYLDRSGYTVVTYGDDIRREWGRRGVGSSANNKSYSKLVYERLKKGSAYVESVNSELSLGNVEGVLVTITQKFSLH